METQIIDTEDGSHSIFNSQLGVTYHSKYGAVQESQTIFIDAGLHFLLSQLPTDYQQPIHIIEMGFGSGLNSFMTFLVALQYPQYQFFYTTWEAYPIGETQAAALNYPQILSTYLDYSQALQHSTIFQAMHQCPSSTWVNLAKNVQFYKKIARFEDFNQNEVYDLMYYDAFAPTVQPELWEEKLMQPIYNSLKINGIFCTYCAKGIFKRLLKSLGFELQPLPGPKGKREMTRAVKI